MEMQKASLRGWLNVMQLDLTDPCLRGRGVSRQVSFCPLDMLSTYSWQIREVDCRSESSPKCASVLGAVSGGGRCGQPRRRAGGGACVGQPAPVQTR